METKSEIGSKQELKNQPETFFEFLRENAIEATREFYAPLFWLKSLLEKIMTIRSK